ncbi:MAG TPA: hypothetical protein VGI39_13310 [Polyangiaceae bacterium]
MPISPPVTADVLARVLAPSVGDNMARAIARTQLEKLGISGSRLNPAQLQALTDALRPGLNVFVGKEAAERIVREVHAALRAESGQGGRDGER